MQRGLFLAIAALLVTGSASAAVVVLDNFDAQRALKFGTSVGGGSVTVGDFVTGDTDNELKKVTGTAANFLQYIKSDGLGRTGVPIDALLAGSGISISVSALDAEISQNFNVQLVVNTNAWADFNGSNGYRGVKTVAVNDGADRSLTLQYSYTDTSSFYLALQRWKANTSGTTFFEFMLDNTGYPAVSTPQTFYIDEVVVTGVPEPTALGLLGAAGLGLMGRRRKA